MISVGWLSGIIGMCIPIAALFFLFLIHALGAGDIKLFSIIGAFVGAEKVAFYMLAAFTVGAIIAIYKLIRYKNFQKRFAYLIQYIRVLCIQHTIIPYYQKTDCKNYRMHFSIPILIGSCLYMVIQ